MTDDEIRMLMIKTLMDIKRIINDGSQEIEQLLENGESELAKSKITALGEKIELETLRAENKILKDGK